MEKKLLKFDEIITALRYYVMDLELWNYEYEEILNKEINDLFYLINVLQSYQDDLIFDLEKERKKWKKNNNKKR